MRHLLKIQFNQSTLATLLVLLFIVPSFLPVVGADSDEESTTSGRNPQLDFFSEVLYNSATRALLRLATVCISNQVNTRSLQMFQPQAPEVGSFG